MSFRPPSRGVCPNYEVAEFQPRKGTTLEPSFCHKLLRTFLLEPSLPLFPPTDFILGGSDPSYPKNPTTDVSPHRSIRPPGRHLSPSQNTDASCHDPTTRCPCSPPSTLPRSRHACRVPFAYASLPLQKLLPP